MMQTVSLFMGVAFLVQAPVAPASPEKEKQPVRISKEEPLNISGDKAEFFTNHKYYVFTGHVQMTHAGNLVLCETLKGYGETVDRIERTECFGNVRWFDRARGATLNCDEAVYYKSTMRLVAKGKPVLRVVQNDVLTLVKGEELEMFSREEKALAHRNVWISRLDMTAKGDEAVYDYHIEQVQMTGHPEVTQRKSVFLGEEIWMYLKEDRVEIRRGVKATVFPEDAEEKPVKP